MRVAGNSCWGYTGTRLDMLKLKSHRRLMISWQRLSSCANQLVLKSHASAFEHEWEVFQHEDCWAAISGTRNQRLCRFAVFNLFILMRAGHDRTPEETSVTVSSLDPRALNVGQLWPFSVTTIISPVCCCCCMTSWVRSKSLHVCTYVNEQKGGG